MSKRLKQAPTPVLAFLCMVLGYIVADTLARTRANKIFAGLENELEHVTVTKNKTITANKALIELMTEDLNQQNKEIKSLVAELNARPTDIRYITKTETVLQPQEPEVVLLAPQEPYEFLYKLEEDIVVGKFKLGPEGEHTHTTYDMSFQNTMVITDNKTATTLQVATSYDDVFREVPVELDVTRITDQPLFEPHLGVGITAGAPTFDVQASLWVSTLHPWKNIDLFAPRLSANTEIASVGIDPLLYNIGEPLPVLTDLWLSVGPSINTQGEVAVDLTLGSKF